MNGNTRAKQLLGDLLANGESAIDRWIQEEISEELYIDYKRSASSAEGSKLDQSDRENLARAITGFGNSEGGIIVWGVDCRMDESRGDVPTAKLPIQNIKRFTTLLDGVTAGCTIPPHDGVQHHPIVRSDGSGFAVTYIPKSMFSPHQCLIGRYKSRYYIRVGSSFELATHGLLAGMFGRQPTPKLLHMWRAGASISPESYAPVIDDRPTATPYVDCEVIIRNDGVSILRDIYVNFEIQLPGSNTIFEALPQAASPTSIWSSHQSVGGIHVISDGRFRLAPAAMASPLRFCIYFKAPFKSSLRWELSFGCAGSQVHRVIGSTSAEEVMTHLSAFMASDRSRDSGSVFARNVMSLERDQEYYRRVDY